jgi:hypothetical protein
MTPGDFARLARYVDGEVEELLELLGGGSHFCQ